jgi:hypothetical protein
LLLYVVRQVVEEEGREDAVEASILVGKLVGTALVES